MKIIALLLVLIVLINSCFGAISILDLKQKCNNYCEKIVASSQNAAEKIVNQAVDIAGIDNVNAAVRHAANDFKYAFPVQYSMIKTYTDYFKNEMNEIQSCSNGCKLLIEKELFNLDMNEN